MNTPLLAALYRRVSTDQQEGSLETQERKLLDYARLKNFTVLDDAMFEDQDTSGGTPLLARDGGAKLAAAIRFRAATTNPIKHLIVSKVDRLARNLEDLLAIIRMLDEMGVVIHILDMGGDILTTQGATGKLMLQILGAFAEFERELIRSRIRDRLGHKFEQYHVIGTVPYGFNEPGTRNPKPGTPRTLIPNPSEQHWIFQMAKWREWGWSYGKIAAELNRQLVPTKLPAGTSIKHRGKEMLTSGLWQDGNVAGVLKSKHTARLLAARAESEGQAVADTGASGESGFA